MKLKARASGVASPGYHVLLALANGPLHGMGIAQQILADSLAKACPSRSTLYEELARLEQAALIESVESGAGRHSYRLTNRGRRVLENETKLLRMIVQTADGRLRY